MAGRERVLECGGALRNGADHAHFRLEGLDGQSDAGAKATATQRNDDIGDVGDILKDFQTDGSLTAQHLVIVERRNVDHAVSFGEFGRVCRGFIEHVAIQHDVGTVRLGGIHLQRGSDGRHANRGLRTAFTGRVRHALRVIARRCGDDAVGKLLFAQRGDLVVCATNLERAGNLQVLRLQKNLMPRHFTQYGGGDDCGMACGAFQTLRCEFQLGCMVTLQRFQYVLLFHNRHCRSRSCHWANRFSPDEGNETPGTRGIRWDVFPHSGRIQAGTAIPAGNPQGELLRARHNDVTARRRRLPTHSARRSPERRPHGSRHGWK